jgi:spermidine synthase
MANRFWHPNAIVFLSNACVMIIELVAGRILAPRIGVSLYTWTSIIGVILAGISLGNFLGGRQADRQASRRLLGSIFLAGALLTLVIIPLAQVSGGIMSWTLLPLVVRIVTITTVSFFLPAVVLGMISPIVVKLSLNDLSSSGNTVGQIYAMSALGSIVGTFLTGFVLISLIGVYQILVAVAIGLALIGLAVGSQRRDQALLAGIVIVVALFMGALNFSRPLCADETNYFCIRLMPVEQHGKQVEALILDRMIHSIVNIDDPTLFEYPYEHTVEAVVKRAFPDPGPGSSLVLGGGGFSFPRFLEVRYPQSRVVAVEIDPGVVQMARDKRWLPNDSAIEVVATDARLYVEQLPADQRFDLVLGDVFNDYSVPYHLTTREFTEKLAQHLTPDGIYVINIVDGVSGDFQFLRSFVTTLRQVFPHVYVIPVHSDWRTRTQPPPTIELVASNRPLELANLPLEHVEYELGTLLAPAELEALMSRGEQVPLTDQYAPTDTLLAPVFSDALQ